jgi:deazaflavin-dependent oxidoreductase (nitroreductase family)
MKTFFKIFTRIHIALYRLTNGALGSRMRGMPVLLLTTHGRKTGRVWTTPVMYLEDSGTYVITASNNGMNRHPAWYLNITAKPEVEIEVNDQKIQVKSATVSTEERTRLWESLVKQASFFSDYQESRTKQIPMVRLTPVG